MAVRPLVLVLLLVTIALAGCTSGGGDSDGDGVPNDVEDQFGTNPNNPDTDGDGLTDFDELITYLHTGVDALTADTDSDGLSDFEEVVLYGADPARVDLDRDTLSDFEEVTLFSGQDCGPDGAEPSGERVSEDEVPRCTRLWGIDPRVADTDDDAWPDGDETSYWMDRLGDAERAGRYANASDVDGDGWADGEDAEPLHDVKVRIEVVSFNLTEDVSGEDGANLTLQLHIENGSRTVVVGDIPVGRTDLNVNWTFDVTDGPGRPEGHDVSYLIQALHDGDEAIYIDGMTSAVVGAHRISDFTLTSTGPLEAVGTEAVLTYVVRTCRPDC